MIYRTGPERAAQLKQRLADLMPDQEIATSRVSPTLDTHVGPKAVALALISG